MSLFTGFSNGASNYSYSGGQPYAGPNRSMDGDPGFEAWRQRQFSAQPFSQGELSAGADKMPTSRSGDQSKPWNDPSGWDPRSIMNGQSYQRLMELAKNGSGAPAQARADAAPAMDWMRTALASGDPLGTQQLPALSLQRGMQAVRSSGDTARRQIDDSAGGANAMANPLMQQFAKVLAGFGQARGIGGAVNDAASVGVQERQASQQFRQGVAQALANLGLGMGGLQQGEGQLQAGAAGQAGQLESFADNTWAQAMSQLLMRQLFGSSYAPAQSAHYGGYTDMDVFAHPGDIGSLQGWQTGFPALSAGGEVPRFKHAPAAPSAAP